MFNRKKLYTQFKEKFSEELLIYLVKSNRSFFQEYFLNLNRNFTFKTILKNKTHFFKGLIFKRCSQEEIIFSPVVTLKILNKLPIEVLRRSKLISINCNVTPDYVRKHPDLNWDIKCLAKNRNFTASDLMQLFPHIDPEKYFASLINFTDEFFEQNRNLFLANLEDFMYNEKVNLKFYLAHPEIKWHNFPFNIKDDITIDFILENPNISWDYENLTKIVDYRSVKAHPELPWRTELLLLNKTLPYEEVENLLSISRNPFPCMFSTYITFKQAERYNINLSKYNRFTIEKKIRKVKFYAEAKVNLFLSLQF